MLLTPPYDTHFGKPYVHGSLPPMQTYNMAPQPHQYELPRYDDYLYSRQFRPSTTTSVIPQPVYQPQVQSYAHPMTTDLSQRKPFAYGHPQTLPPIHAPEHPVAEQQVKPNPAPAASQKQQKEEKIGGVAVHLDYKMDEMVDFVSEMSQGMYGIFRSKICLADIDMIRSVMNSKTTVLPEFRRYVSQVLTSTRLPSSTILLGLHYLAVRLTLLSSRGDYEYGGGDVYSLLTTALLLGSKFLDDNTFQNRSWSDVSNISVKKLNFYETEWLRDINWDMHFDVSDPKGFALWLRRWQSFQYPPPSKNVDLLVDSLKKTSLDESFKQQRAPLQQKSINTQQAPPYLEIRTSGHRTDDSARGWHASHNGWKYGRDSEYSPPSAPETGPNTPEYTIPNGFEYGALRPTYPSLKMPAPLHILPSNAPIHGYPTPQYEQYTTHGNYCGCSYCNSYVERSSFNYGYHQTVAG